MDFIARRYGTLPSIILEKGSSLDIQVAEIAVGYENYVNDKDPGKDYSQADLQNMVNKVKEKHGNKT